MADQLTLEEQVKVLAEQIAGIKLQTLIKPTDGGPFTFETMASTFEAIQEFYHDAGLTRLAHVPPNELETIRASAHNLLNALTQVRDFKFANTTSPGPARDNLRGNVVGRWQEAYDRSVTHFAFASTRSSAVTAEIQSLKQNVAESRRTFEDLKKKHEDKTKQLDDEIKKRITDWEKVMAAARDASAKSAVSEQAREFDQEADSAQNAARIWLVATTLLVAASLYLIYWMFLQHPNQNVATNMAIATGTNSISPPGANISNATIVDVTTDTKMLTAATVQQTIARILIITLIYGFVILCGRNYYACRHNYTINRHRRNAMKTFKAFVEGTEDPGTKDFILKQAAACAFSPQQTGYLKDESLPTPAPTSQIIDIVRSPENQ